MKTFGEAREAASKAIDAMAEVVADLMQEIVRLNLLVAEYQDKERKARNATLPPDPDLTPDDGAEINAVVNPPPVKPLKPYGQNGETTCISCGKEAEYATVTRLRPLVLMALTCRKHIVRGENKHALRLKEYRRMFEDQQKESGK